LFIRKYRSVSAGVEGDITLGKRYFHQGLAFVFAGNYLAPRPFAHYLPPSTLRLRSGQAKLFVLFASQKVPKPMPEGNALWRKHKIAHAFRQTPPPRNHTSPQTFFSLI